MSFLCGVTKGSLEIGRFGFSIAFGELLWRHLLVKTDKVKKILVLLSKCFQEKYNSKNIYCSLVSPIVPIYNLFQVMAFEKKCYYLYNQQTPLAHCHVFCTVGPFSRTFCKKCDKYHFLSGFWLTITSNQGLLVIPKKIASTLQSFFLLYRSLFLNGSGFYKIYLQNRDASISYCIAHEYGTWF